MRCRISRVQGTGEDPKFRYSEQLPTGELAIGGACMSPVKAPCSFRIPDVVEEILEPDITTLKHVGVCPTTPTVVGGP